MITNAIVALKGFRTKHFEKSAAQRTIAQFSSHLPIESHDHFAATGPLQDAALKDAG
jgi:hypothetical protein